MSLELPFTGDKNRNAHCDVKFRQKGQRPWRDGLRLFADYETDQVGFRGSLVLLQPNTDYEIRLLYTDPEGGSGEKNMTAKTWSETFPAGTITKVTSSAPFKAAFGTPGAYRVYDGDANKTLIDANEADFCIDLKGASYVIIRNLKLTKSNKHAINIKNAHHIIIEDCEIFEWGKPGYYCEGTGGIRRRDGAVYVATSRQIVIQHNTIHDPRANTCDWRTAHPNGPRGIFFDNNVEQTVFRYNRISGSPDHYYDDVITGDTDGCGSDIDIYGNEVSHAWDDGIEIEGRNKNIRVWNNVIRQVFQGLASDNNKWTYYGPVYIWRNVFTDLHARPATPGGPSTGRGFKLENSTGKGSMYIFNNTLLGTSEHLKPVGAISNGPQFNLVALNNIFDTEKGQIHDKVDACSFFNHNGYAVSRLNTVKSDWETKGLFNAGFTYDHPAGWNYYLKPNSKGKDAGVKINNFAEKFDGKAPDLGAAEPKAWQMRVGPHADKQKW